MNLQTFETCLRPFVESPYVILDDDFAKTGDVFICAADGLVPRLGDRFTIECAEVLHDVGVCELTTFRDGWTAICRLDGV